MRLMTFIHDGGTQAGVRSENAVIPLRALSPKFPSDLKSLLQQELLQDVGGALDAFTGDGIPLDEVKYEVLIPQPG